MREPVSRLRSAFSYDNIYKKLNLPKRVSSIYRFLNNVKQYANRKDIVELTINRVSHEFGYDPNEDINDYMDEINSRFLVLVLELFDESLVILRRSLGWSLKDVLYLPQMTGSYDHTKDCFGKKTASNHRSKKMVVSRAED